MQRLFLGAAVTAAVAALALPASAGTPQPASGAGTNTPPTVTSSRTTPGGTTIVEFTNTGTVTGTFTGTFVQTGRMVVHGDGSSNSNTVVLFTGTAGSCGTGTVTVRFVGHTTAGVGTGHSETIRHADNTVDVHSNLDFVVGPSTFTYSGTFHCG